MKRFNNSDNKMKEKNKNHKTQNNSNKYLLPHTVLFYKKYNSKNKSLFIGLDLSGRNLYFTIVIFQVKEQIHP